MCVRSGVEGRLHSDGVRSGAESDGARPHGGAELRPPEEAANEARRQTDPSTTKHNTAREHVTIKGSQKHFSIFPSFFFFLFLSFKTMFRLVG